MNLVFDRLLQEAISAHQEERFLEAELKYKKAIELKPTNSQAFYNLAVLLHDIRRLDEAEINYKKTIELKPDHPNANINLGILLHGVRRFNEAEVSYKKGLEIKPDHPSIYNNLGVTQECLGKLDEAEACYKKAIEFKPDYAEANSNLGNILKKINKIDKALTQYKRAIELKPSNPDFYLNHAILLQGIGRFDEAKTNYEKSIKLKPTNGEAHFRYSQLKKFNKEDEHLIEMHKLFLDHSIDAFQRCYIAFALGKAFRDLNQFDESFKYYSEGNVMYKKIINYNISQDIELFDELKKSYPNIKKNSLRLTDKSNKRKIIFIIGMPRSGTTLIEQIISSHSKVSGAGELDYVHQLGHAIASGITKVNNDILLDFREKYFKKLNKLSNNNFIVTDKMPLNFRYLGLIYSAFPEAKIIHVKRNPASTCWGNYQKVFGSKGLNFSYNLDDLTAYYKLYQNLMQFWEKHYGDSIYNLNYEALILNQEYQTKKLIQYLGLDWEEECLAPEDNIRGVFTSSNVQIRQKVYRDSSEEWKKYKPFLKGALDNLDDSL